MAPDLVLDPGRLAPGPDGLPGLHWPLARREMEAVRAALDGPLERPPKQAIPEDEDVFSALNLAFLNQTLAVFQAHAIHTRLAARGVRPMPPPGSTLLPALASGAPLPDSRFAVQLRRGPTPVRGRVPPPVRLLARTWELNGPKPRVLLPARPGDIVAVHHAPLVKAHARAVRAVVRYRPADSWFAPAPEDAAGNRAWAGRAHAAIEASLDAAARAFDAGGEKMPPQVEDHLRAWWVQAGPAARHHLDRARGRPLPAALWTGTGGELWTRLLRHAVRRAGGHVTGHDHGVGSGHVDLEVKRHSDLVACDAFLTTTEAQAEALRARFGTRVAIRASPGRPVPHPPPAPPPAEARRVMYLSSFYNGERIHYSLQVPDLVQVDWEARLYGKLRAWGYVALHKPHPGALFPAPASYAQGLGVRVLTQPFEQVMHLADVVILTHIQSTAAVSAITAGKAVVFVDPGLFRWPPGARALIQRRCRMVPAWFDEDQRIQTDWDDLRAAIPDALALRDPAFEHAFLRHAP